MVATRLVLSGLCLLLAVGCESTPADRNLDATLPGNLSSYAQSPAEPQPLAGSLFKEDQALLSNEDMSRILATQVQFPSNAKLAVVRFGSMPYWWGWSEEFVRMNDQIDRDFLAKLSEAPNIKAVSYLPSLVTPNEMTLPHLRQAAVRFQADMLLIYRTSSRNYGRSKFFQADESKAFCTVEAILLDTRTGIIPWSTVLNEQYSSKRTNNDYDFSETTAKANQQAIAKAWSRLAGELAEYFKDPKSPQWSSPRQPTTRPGF